MVAGHSHRPTLKQQNKAFKSRHSTKSSIKDQSKGRVPRASVKALPSSNAAQTRLNRKNAAKQTQQTKRQAIVAATRVFSGVDGAPRVVAVIPLCSDVDAKQVVLTLVESIGQKDEKDECPESGLYRMRADRFKASLQFIVLPYRQLYAALDAARAADYVVLALSPETEVDPWGDLLLRCLQSQGFPEVITVVHSNKILDPKARPGINKSLLSFIRYFIPSAPRIYDLSTNSDATNAFRALCDGKPADPRWRDRRVRILAETVAWEGESEDERGILKVTGVVRGSPLSADRLIHIPAFGDYKISAVYSAPLKRGSGTMELEATLLAEPDVSSADSLISTNDPDDMANEQTWPTEEEMNSGTASDLPKDDLPPAPKRGVVRRVPKGTSSYQAAWIVDDEDDEEDEDEEDEEGDDIMKGEDDGVEPEPLEEVEEEETEILFEPEDEESRKSVAFQDLDMEEESKQLADWRSREREFEADMSFPDEVDTPKEIAARTRFQRYRGLQSFRTSPWDPYENLPRDYARIFQLEDWERTGRRVINEEGVPAGQRVTVHIKGVPREAASAYDPKFPFIIFALHRHEHKKSVLNFTLQRNTEYTDVVRSKDPLVLCVGPRRILTNPIFSQHTRGGGKGSNNVHKFERFLRPTVTSVGTIYGPLIFGKQPCLVLKPTEDPQAPELVASGTFLNPSPQRIIAKRIVLTGHPFKVHKKTATIRYMLFNSDDVDYFKPIQLHTKHGRIGHIRDSLGTHGYFKAHFDGPINQMDTVCMNLYKRVYPKWSSDWDGPTGGTTETERGDVMEE